MLATELPVAIAHSKRIFEKIKIKYPRIMASLALSKPEGYAPIDSSLEYLLDKTDHFFIESETVKEAWILLDQIWDLNESLKEVRRNLSPIDKRRAEEKIRYLQFRYQYLIPFIEIKPSVEVVLIWDEIDYEINRFLRSDKDLIDVSRTPQIGGIKISLGTIEQLRKER